MLGTTLRRRLAGGAALALAAVVLVLIVMAGGGEADPSSSEAVPETQARDRPPDAGGGGPATELSDGELVDQVILAGFEGTDPGSAVVGEVADHQLGGVLVESTNWAGAAVGKKLVAAVRDAGSKEGRIPPLIAVAQEGGVYRALDDLPPELREVEIGDKGRTELAETWSSGTSKALRDAGFDLNLAPVADVATLDSPIADRAFSDDPTVAAEMTAAAVKACLDAGIACAPSHFPGLGAASQDTDDGPTSIGLDAATLADRDLVPFQTAIKAGAPALVVSSAFYTAYDPVTPASLSPAVSTDLLRRELGFKGVAISDDLSGGAISAVATPGEAAVRAVAAGIDLVQIADPKQVGQVRDALTTALADGTLDEGRLREAAGRVLTLKDDIAAG